MRIQPDEQRRRERDLNYAHLRDVVAARGKLDAEISQLVDDLHNEGVTWDELSDALGMSRQSTYRRYGPRRSPLFK